MQKRGQLTIFIVLGIVLLATAVGLYFLVSSFGQQGVREASTSPLAAQLRPQVQAYVEQCIEEVAVPGIYLLAMQGGVIYPDDQPFLYTSTNLINYASLFGVNYLQVERMEQHLVAYLEQQLPACLTLESFKQQGYKVKTGDLEPRVRIESDNVFVVLKYPITLEKKEKLALSTFQTAVSLRLGYLAEEATLVAQQHKEPLPVFTSLAFLTQFPFDSDTTIYSLSDEISEPPLVLMFAVREQVNAAPVLDPISDLTAQATVPFSYELTASDLDGDILTFFVEGSQAQITSDGFLYVANPVVGRHKFVVGVQDATGGQDKQEVQLIVE